MENTIRLDDRDSLLADLLRLEVSRIHGACEDSEGRTDYADLDHYMDIYEWDLREIESTAEIFSVFCEESARFAR